MADTDKKLKSALEIFGQDYIEELGRQLIAAGKDSTGNLLRSLDHKVIKTGFGTSYTIQILAEEYLTYVDEGRRPGGKQPPLDNIRAWTVTKGIDPGLAFPIARKIAEDGIPPTHVIMKALDKVLSDASYVKLEEGISDWADDVISDMVFGLSKNKNITVR